MTVPFQLEGIAQIAITVDDVPRAIQFYRDVLGLKFLFEVPGQSMAFFDCGGVRLYLGRAEKEEHRQRSFIYYRVPSMTAAYDGLRERGVEFQEPPHAIYRTETFTLWLAAFRDPDGNYLQLMREVPLGAETP